MGIARDTLLSRIESDFFKFGHATEETSRSAQLVSCSKGSIDKAVEQGRMRRYEVYEKYKVNALYDDENKIRESLKRSLSCGDTLMEPRNVDKIKKLYEAKQAIIKATKAADTECKK